MDEPMIRTVYVVDGTEPNRNKKTLKKEERDGLAEREQRRRPM
jgi:hypothetical protein